MSDYTFNTRTVFLLGKFLKHFEGNIDDVVKIIESIENSPNDDILSAIGLDRVIRLIFQVIGSASEAESTAIKLLASASRRSEKEVQDMDGLEFISQMRQFIMSIDWKRLMGESLGLSLQAEQSTKTLLKKK